MSNVYSLMLVFGLLFLVTPLLARSVEEDLESLGENEQLLGDKNEISSLDSSNAPAPHGGHQHHHQAHAPAPHGGHHHHAHPRAPHGCHHHHHLHAHAPTPHGGPHHHHCRRHAHALKQAESPSPV
ncbi:hypothetical protein CASFOL_041526 [Castilleja foliolosa]|uniref:Uncharacterized protein n=1 Tax=Castilleja foliolosa TaxID=1961234 RepID=A0ABD3BB78_9LAMI